MDIQDLKKPMLPDFSGGPATFIKEVRTELNKVIWPTRDEVIKLTIVVIIISAAIGIYIGGLDVIMTRLTSLFVTG